MGFVAMGLAFLLALFAARLIGLVVALPLVMRARGSVLAVEIAMIGMAIPAALHPFIALAEELRTLLPSWFVLALSVLASILLFGGALVAVAIRERGWRIASLASSLIGLGILGACEASRTALLFILLWLGPMPAFLAASSIAGRVERGTAIAPREQSPHADFVNVLLALACLAVIGLPPFAGFWARLILVQAAWGASDYPVVAITLLSSLVLGLALARRSFERAAPTVDPARRNRAPGIALPELLVLGVMSGLTLAGGLYPAPFIIISDANAGHGPQAYDELTVRR
jgi:formate hydrogenlyase subunit 3/multisubunit Na+/H+ antiporter MnhD subunit